MTLARFPFSSTLFRDFDQLFRDFPVNEAPRELVPATDILETPKAIELHLDLPGVTAENIDVKVEGNTLTITAERKTERALKDKEAWVRQERSWGHFARSFTLPNTVESSKPEATYKHGVLTVVLPKREEVQPKSFKVRVES